MIWATISPLPSEGGIEFKGRDKTVGIKNIDNRSEFSHYLGLDKIVMKLSKSIKPISYFKAHASELIRKIFDQPETLVITQNGEAKAIIQDIKTYEQTQESLALLKILAQSQHSLSQGKIIPAKKVFEELKNKLHEFPVEK